MVVALIGAPAAAISLGQIDDFQLGTLEGWSGGAAPTSVATGGPAGSGDHYLAIRAVSSNLGATNVLQWSGDYASAGVTALRFDLNNQGPDPVALRISLFGPAASAFTTIHEAVLPAASGWVAVTFALDEDSLVRTSGTFTLAQTLASVAKLLIRHDPDPLSPPGEHNFVSATLGIDNVAAVPEPAAGPLFAVGLAALAHALRRRRIARRP